MLLPLRISGFLCCLCIACTRSAPPPHNDVIGRWQGTATAFGAQAPLTVDFRRAGDSIRAAVTMSAEAMLLDYPLDSVRFAPPRVHFEFSARQGRNGVFDGIKRGDTIEGVARKNNNEVRMRFIRESITVPSPPYRQEIVSFVSADGTRLEGTLFKPGSAGPHPAVVLIHGSGPGMRADHNYVADRFARAGIAAFAYDKRGSGASKGDARISSYETFADDALGAVAAITGRSDVDSSRIGLAGFSEGGWVAPLAAAKHGNLAFVIGVAAPGGTYALNGVYQNIKRLEEAGAPAAEIDRYRRLISETDDLVRETVAGDASPTSEARRRALQVSLDAFHRTRWSRFVNLPRRVPAGSDLGRLRWRVLDFDPAPYWELIKAPVLIVLGERDRNVDSRQSAELIRDALKCGGNRNGTFVILARATHALMIVPGAGEDFHFPYPAAGYPDTLAAWARAHVFGPSGR